VYLDSNGAVIPYPTVVANYGITDVEIGPQYDSVGIEGNVGHYLCTANFVPNYAEPNGAYLWSKSGNWDSIGLTVNHIKRTYNFLTDPVEWTETGAGQTAQQLGMDDLTQAGPTRVRASIGLEDIPGVPDYVSVSMGTEFRFNVNIGTAHNVILDQLADIEHFSISSPGAFLTIASGAALYCRNGLENAGSIYGPIALVSGTGLANSGLIQGALGQVDGPLVNTGEIRCEGGSIHGSIQNDGVFEIWNETTLDTLSVSGGGTVKATGKLTLQNSNDPAMGVILEQPLVSHMHLVAPNRLQTLGGSISAEGIAQIAELQGTLSVLPGKTLLFYGQIGHNAVVTAASNSTLAWRSGDNAGSVDISGGATLLLDELTYDITNTGTITVTDATFHLPGPSSFPYHWTGQFLNNDGTIRLDHSEMIFGVYPNFHGYSIGPVIRGSGSIELLNGSRLIDPAIAASGSVSIDATSRVEFNNLYRGTRALAADISNNGTISFAADGLIRGTLGNNGRIEVAGGTAVIDVATIAGTGAIDATGGGLTLQYSADPDRPVAVEQPVASQTVLKTPNSFITTGNGAITAAGRMEGSGNGKLAVTTGKTLIFYGGTLGDQSNITVDGAETAFAWRSGDNAGSVDISGGATLLLDELTYDITNTGTIAVTDATFHLPGPSSFPYQWTGQFLTNEGTIHLDNSQMSFGVAPYYGQVIGPVIKGNGNIELTNGSVLRDPRIASMGGVSVDATSRLEMTACSSGFARNLSLAGRMDLAEGSRLVLTGTWDTADGAVLSDGEHFPCYLEIRGHWQNRMTDPDDFDLSMALIEAVGGTQASPVIIEAASVDLGDVPEGWQDNFAMNILTVKAGGYLYLVDQFDNSDALDQIGPSEAVYVDQLILESGAILNAGDLNIYYKTLRGDPAQIIHQPIPEPSLLSLLACGSVALLRRRRG